MDIFGKSSTTQTPLKAISEGQRTTFGFHLSWLQERRFALREKIVCAHKPQDFLGIYGHALAAELGCTRRWP